MAKLGLLKSCKFPTFGFTRGHQNPENGFPEMWYTFLRLFLAKTGRIVKIATFGASPGVTPKWSKMAIWWFAQKTPCTPKTDTKCTHTSKRPRKRTTSNVQKNTFWVTKRSLFGFTMLCPHVLCIVHKRRPRFLGRFTHVCKRSTSLWHTFFTKMSVLRFFKNDKTCQKTSTKCTTHVFRGNWPY